MRKAPCVELRSSIYFLSRKKEKFMKKKIALVLAVVLALTTAAFGLTGCGSSKKSSENKDELASMSWKQVEKKAKGTTVTFYGWGGDVDRNAWLEKTVKPYMQKKYGIKLKVVGMDIDDILSKLSSDKEGGAKKGSIDVIWINGENFYSAKDNGLLYGPFTSRLPNMKKYVDLNDQETKYDFCKPIKGYEAPYAKAQFVFYNDSKVTPDTPKSAQELLEFCKKNKGKVTYPALPDFTGSAFVRNIIYETCGGYKKFQNMKADKATVKKAIQPAIKYLRELNPYLWKQGKTFPDSSTKLDTMYQDGTVVLDMSYNPFSVKKGIDDGLIRKTNQTFVFDKGTIGNTSYMAIAYDSPNKAGAEVLINAILSPQMQLSQYKEVKSLPVLDSSKLSTSEKKEFDSVDMGQGTLSQDTLLKHRVPEMPADLVPVIEKIWSEEVVGK